MKKLFFLTLVGSTISLFFMQSSASAARPTAPQKTSTPLGLDVSWPQCGERLPSNHSFGIVGVNGGLATNTNPCLQEQLLWASKALANTSQEPVQLYVNTANPAGLNTESWSKNNTDPSGTVSPNPHGSCDGNDSLACAWQYGWNRAVEDVNDRFRPAVYGTSLNKDPSTYIWWLDVETENSWKLSGFPADQASNVAVLEGMASYFRSIGARIGLYSTAQQFGQIAGNQVLRGSLLNGLPNWRPGGASLATAKDACKAAPLTKDGKVVLTQYIAKGLDYNYVCQQ